MGIKNWLLNRRLKKDREENPDLYANVENYSLKCGEIDFCETDIEKEKSRRDKEILKLEKKIEKYR